MSYNTSDNSIVVQAQLSPFHNSYTVSGVPGITYYITVFAVNALGPGTIDNDSIATGNTVLLQFIITISIYVVMLSPISTATMTVTQTSTNVDTSSSIVYVTTTPSTCITG